MARRLLATAWLLAALACAAVAPQLAAQEPAPPPAEPELSPEELEPPDEVVIDEDPPSVRRQGEERVPLPEPGEVPPGPAPPDEGTMLRPDPPVAGEEPPGLVEGERPAPPRVAAIEIRSDTRLTEDELDRLGELVAFAVGELLTDGTVARTLRNLQASGLASRVAVLTRPAAAGQGVVAVIALWGNVIVSEVRIVGDTGAVSNDRLREVVPQRAGEPLVEARLVEGVFAMQDRLTNSGHFGATVRLDPEIDPDSRQARVIYRVEAGPRATVGEVTFAGDTAPFARVRLIEQLRAGPGEPYRRATVIADSERLETWLIEQGHRTARVGEPTIEPAPAERRVAVTFPVEVGPRVEAEVIGADMKKLRRRGLLPFLSDEGYDEALVLLATQRIRTWYQEQGHYDVEVDYREELADGVLRVVVEVDPGPQVELEDVAFVGNEEVDDDTLRNLVQTAPAGLLATLPFVDGGALVDEVLDADVDNVLAYYRLSGYLDAEVGPARVERRDGGLHVAIPIEEGRRRTVEEIRFSGLEALDEDAVRDSIPLAEDGPYHPAIVDESLEVVRSRYDIQGYNAAQVSATREWDAEESRATVTIRVLEGPQTVVDRVIVRGNEDTLTQVIRDAIQLDPGDPASTTALLEAERDLYRLGIFSRVEVELTPAPLGASTRDVVVRVEEGDVRRVTYGAGYDSESGFGGILGYSHANLLGRAIHGAVDVRVRQEREEYRLFVDQPQFFGYSFPVTYTLFQTQEERASFEVRRRGVRVEGVKQLGRTRFGLAYDYRIVENRPADPLVTPEPGEPDPTDPDAPDPADLQRQYQELQVASLVPNVFVDRRDDPISPTEGWNTIAQLQYAFPLFAAEADWLKLFVQHVQYFELGFGTFVASARLGGIEPFSGLPAEIDDPFIPNLPSLDLASEDVFLAERFFAGGATTHRGYEQDELGIPFSTCQDDGVFDPASDCAATLFRPDPDGDLEAAGGNGLALVNLEYRFPIFGPVEGVAFFDTGNVWSDWRQIDPGEFAHGVGLGLRYVSPIGPLRLDVGYPLDPIGGDDGVVWFISLGNPF